MSTNDKKVNIFLKKFLPRDQFVDNFLEYLLTQSRDILSTLYPDEGVFFGGGVGGSAVDEFTVGTPMKASDGKGHLLDLDPLYAACKFENSLGIPYHIGLRYQDIPSGTEVNVRTGAIEYTFFEEGIGEKADPTSVIDNGSTVTFILTSITEAGVSNAGRKVRAWLKKPIGQADAFYEGVVYFSGGSNRMDTTHIFGQTAGLVSTNPADYEVVLLGPTVKRNTNLDADPNYIYLGTVEGAGAGVQPTVFNAGDVNLLFGAGAVTPVMDQLFSFLTGGGNISWDLTTQTLAWGAQFVVILPNRPYTFQIAAGSQASIADGDVLYIVTDNVGGVKAIVKVPAGTMPDDPTSYPVATRKGNEIYFRDGVLELQGDASSTTTGRIDGITEDILAYMGAANESDADPDYKNATGSAVENIHLTDGESLTRAIKRLELRNDVVVKVKAIDLLQTVLPTGATVTIDGQTISNNQFVLFANPALNKVYKATNIGVSVVWVQMPVFGGVVSPGNMSLVGVQDSANEFMRNIWQYTSAVGWKPYNLSEVMSEPTGFPNRTDSEISFVDGTRTFTIQPKTPATEFYYFQKGRVFKVEAAQTVVIPDTEGVHYIYFDGVTLQSTQTFSDDIIKLYTFVATIYWDATNNEAVFLSEERHALTMDGKTHEYLHNTVGMRWVNGLGVTYTPGAGASNSDSQIAVGDGLLYDEDISITPTDDPAPSDIFEQILDPIAEVPILYRDGASGDWRKFAATVYPAHLGAARLQYNDPAGPWTLVDAPANGDYVAVWLFATNDIRHPIIAIMGQRFDSVLNDALANNLYESLSFGNLPSLEMKVLYRLIFRTDATFANANKSFLADVRDLRKAADVSLGAYTPSAHNLLSARNAANAHPASSIQTVLTNFLGALSPDDVEVQKALETFDKHFQQLRLKEHPSDKNRVVLSGSSVTLSTGTVLEQQIKNLILKFDGAVIDFSTGEIFEPDGTTPFNGGLNDFTPIIPGAGLFRWFSITLLPSTANANNTINGQLIVLAGASDGASKLLAARAPFASGTKIGQVVVQEDTGSIADILQDDITQQGTGGGGSGEGTGDANSFLEDLKARLRDSFWKWLTPNIFSQQESTLVDPASTGAYDIANTEYDLTTIGNALVTRNLLGAQFKASDLDAVGGELHVLWNTPDPIAVYEMSLNGGTTWEPVAMNQIANSKKYIGELLAFNPATAALHENAVANADSTKTFNATTQQLQAMPIVVGAGLKHKTITGNVYLNKLGTPTGDLLVRLVRDNAGAPSNLAADILAEASPISIGALSAGDNTVPVSLSARLPAGTYWLVLVPTEYYRTTGFSAGVNELRWRTDTSSPSYAAGTLNIYDGTTWSAVAGEDATFQLNGFAYDLRVRITSATATVALNGLGVFFSETGAFTKDTPLPEFQRFVVNGNSDQTVFTMTTFVPDPTTLRVVNGFTGQTYIYGDFAVQGRDVIFPSGTFLFPGDTRGVVFDQRMGFGQGNDRALAILAANALGSTDPQYDLSQAGKGILLRRPDGTLRMLRLDNSDNIVIESVP